MSTTELIDPPTAADAIRKPGEGTISTSAQPLHDGWRDIVSLLLVVPQAGPPIILIGVPLVLFALLLAGPAMLLLTLFVLLLVCAALVTLAGAIVAAPFLLARRLRRHWLARTPRSAPAARFVPVGSRQGTA
jgi:hypothetical protein